MERPEVVDHRRPDALPLRRTHPVREVKDVEAADEALGDRMPDRPPRAPRGMGERHRDDAALDVEPGERLVEQLPPANADRTERNEFVATGVLDHASEGAEDVVADPRSRMREGRDVVSDPHGAR